MIKSDGYVAVFDHDGRVTTKPVVAWDDDGRALVVDFVGGRLTPATGYINFKSLREADDPAVSAVPGQGWTVENIDDDGTVRVTPIIAFTLDVDGWGRAVVASTDGTVDVEQNLDGERMRLIPPGGWTSPRKTDQ